ncbi:hypothetical protein BDV33DRAFT_196881 [Aspergillus novoparasiticus]|uniref:Aminoglycoside phosphotransferase domain-containing protein n=1 Tax=Aspergillus novoparasiticus TaxID=986946 RepID=A0A5N6E824_9EURO|nr:hypothetical protein BDV33DRAFT_196881 [Aspergillus novoparasiticus]
MTKIINLFSEPSIGSVDWLIHCRKGSKKYADSWLDSFHSHSQYVAIKDFILRYHPGQAAELKSITGGCNIIFWLIYKDMSSAVLRMPIPDHSQFLDKLENTSIPLGPFILVEFTDHNIDLGTALITPGLKDDDRAILDPIIYINALNLFQTPLAKIGSSSACPHGNKAREINGNPLSLHWNELVRLGACPSEQLPSQEEVFTTSSSYFSTLADLHIKQLLYQSDDSITSESDCHRKFLSRILFRNFARDNTLITLPDNIGPFKALAKCKLAGVIDWEFIYAAPAEVSCSSPRWLLVEKLENWAKRLYFFLDVLQESEEQRLSFRMRESWEVLDCVCCDESFAFDMMFRERLDKIFFAPDSNWEIDREYRTKLLGEDEQAELDQFVKEKLENWVYWALIIGLLA